MSISIIHIVCSIYIYMKDIGCTIYISINTSSMSIYIVHIVSSMSISIIKILCSISISIMHIVCSMSISIKHIVCSLYMMHKFYIFLYYAHCMFYHRTYMQIYMQIWNFEIGDGSWIWKLEVQTLCAKGFGLAFLACTFLVTIVTTSWRYFDQVYGSVPGLSLTLYPQEICLAHSQAEKIT